MSLYGRTDSNTNKTKAGRGVGSSSQTKTIVFVDNTEAALAVNKNRGINAPGWWSYFTFTDCQGNTRHKAEHLITIGNPDTNANETQLDDTIAADAATTITISAQPANVTGASTPFTGTFAVTAAGQATLQYQWQRQTATGTTWANLSEAGVFSGTTGPILTLTAAAKATYNGYKFRVKITSSAGAPEIISNTASLTYA